MRFITAILIVVIILSGLVILKNFLNRMEEESPVPEKEVYQGPVRPTDDKDYFRKTGITKPAENLTDGD